MKSFAELQAENRRCAFLRFLLEEPDYAMNTSLMQDALAAVGHGKAGSPGPALARGGGNDWLVAPLTC